MLQEALYRQLLEYRRHLDHAQEECLSLTSELDRIRSGEAALRASWQSISPSITLDSFPAFSDFESPQDYAAALEDLVKQHIQARAQQEGKEDTADVSELQRLTAETLANKQALALTQAQLQSVKTQLDHMQDKWARAEKRADRSLSSTVALLEKRFVPQAQPPTASESKPPPAAEAASSSSATAPSLSQTNDTEQQPSTTSQQHQQQQQQEMSALYEAEEQLRRLAAQRQTEIDQLKLALQYPTDDAVRKSPAYAALKAELDNSRTDVDTALRQLEALQTELDTLREVQVTWRDALLRDHAISDELEKRHIDREKDLARIRLQREELKAENMELKLRDAEKHKSVEQVRELANSKEVRSPLTSRPVIDHGMLIDIHTRI